MVEMKLTEKEEKVTASVISFLQGYKDCPKEKKEEYIINNAFMARNVIAFKNLEPKNSYAFVSSYIIHNMIPYLVAKDDEKIDEVAERIDNKVEDLMREMIKELQENTNFAKPVKNKKVILN